MPVVDRVNWLRNQVEGGRHVHVSYGASCQPGIITIKVSLRPKRFGVCDGQLQQFYLGHVEAIWRLVTAHHSADRGHKLSDGSSTIRFWVTLDEHAKFDNITYDVADPLPVPPPVVSFSSSLAHIAQEYDVAACDRDVSLDVIDTQNNAIFALTESVADKLDKLSLVVAALRDDVSTQFGRSREQIVVGLDGLANSLDEYTHQPRTVDASYANSMLNADPNIVAAMCLAVPMDTGSQCNILGGVTRDSSAQTIASYNTLHSYMSMDLVSRVPADESDSESDGWDHNIVVIGGNLRFQDPLFEQVVDGHGGVTGVYFDFDTEERLYEFEFGDRMFAADFFQLSDFAAGVE